MSGWCDGDCHLIASVVRDMGRADDAAGLGLVHQVAAASAPGPRGVRAASGLGTSRRDDDTGGSRCLSFRSAAVRKRFRSSRHRPGAGFRGQDRHAPGSGPPGRLASRHCRIIQAAGGPRT
jgi:hypothetical protein